MARVRFLLVLFAAVLFAVGWVAGHVAGAAVWCWSAMAVGWDSARAPRATVTEIEQRRAV